jgi:hypothetical protein
MMNDELKSFNLTVQTFQNVGKPDYTCFPNYNYKSFSRQIIDCPTLQNVPATFDAENCELFLIGLNKTNNLHYIIRCK